SSKHAGLQIGDVELDTACYGLSVANEAVDISRREFTLLKALMENAGRVLTRESLESKLYSWNEEVASNTIEVHIHHLRKKLPKGFIKTLRGVGYIVKPA
ncbi:MAG: winged helix-turn-helix domain-containing protein, partial [Cycloclasticus pugetii]